MALKLIAAVLFVATLAFPIPVVLSSEDFEDEVTVFDNVNLRPIANLGVTLPGTKWCGPGDNAQDPEDLGSWKEVDGCCRAHDTCFDYIEARDTKHGLKNPDIFTRLHCNCEQDFRKCLRKVNSYLSSAIGNTYATARKYCYKLDYPIKKCVKYQEGIIQNRCIKYKLDKKKPKEWQWFEIPFY